MSTLVPSAIYVRCFTHLLSPYVKNKGGLEVCPASKMPSKDGKKGTVNYVLEVAIVYNLLLYANNYKRLLFV